VNKTSGEEKLKSFIQASSWQLSGDGKYSINVVYSMHVQDIVREQKQTNK
jgi:hypothetical protein